ncbi:MAG TPA: MFS transporter [Caulobacteraceae bacterium]|jgi:PAT family beta-lactamase induction signal transducer AmpG
MTVQAVKAPKRSLGETLAALSRPKVALMLALGFSSGLPFMLINNTLGYWLAEDHVRLALIGFLSWIGLTYAVKFVYGAVVDRLRAPITGALGRRRGWMALTQVGVGAGLIAMALADPRAHLGLLALAGIFTGVCAASQDTVIDAWRIESAVDGEELGLLTSAYSLGFRLALLATESWILILATRVGWPISYAIYGGLMGIGLAATFLIKEPLRADQVMEIKAGDTRRHPVAGAVDAVVGPFVEFFRAHGWASAALMLALITAYHLSDYMRGPMVNPYYQALAIPKLTVAGVRTTLGIAASFAGIALGGVSCLRLGVRPTLVIGAIVQPLAVAAFALLGWHGGDWTLAAAGPVHLTAFEAIMTLDGVTMAYAGVALVVYMSTLTSLGYTATQYALLTSALVWSGKFLKGFSGVIVEQLHQGRALLDAYALFYLLCAAIGIPAILLSLLLARPAVTAQPASA